MKLNTDSVNYLINLTTSASVASIDRLVIEKSCVLGKDEERTKALFEEKNILGVDILPIGLNRVSILNSRLNMVKNLGDISIELINDEGKQITRSLLITNKKLKIEHRCTNPDLLFDKTKPRKINDRTVDKINFDNETIAVLQQGKVAMETKTVVFERNMGKVAMKLVNINGDEFIYQLPSTSQEESQPDFTVKYPIDTLLPFLKHIKGAGFFNLGEKGSLNILINNFNFYVSPQR